MSDQKSFFEALSPKASFTFGIVGGILVLCTIGFFVMLGVYFSGGDLSSAEKSGSGQLAADNNQPAAQQNNNQGQQQPGQQQQKDISMAEVTEDDWRRGAQDPKVTIVEYSDFECPFCKRFHQTMKKVMDNYGDQVQWVFRHAPLEQLHSKAPKEALAAECAGRIGGNDKFWAFTDKIFEVTPSNDGLNLDKLPDYAEQVGVNRSKFESCLDSGKYKSEVNKELRDAKKAGLRGTPYSVAIGPNGKKVPISGAQPYQKVKQIIESML
ncbi:MAG: DsbA family protein [Candidatus Paceibacteria bacterium]